jgi:hypothetical protein
MADNTLGVTTHGIWINVCILTLGLLGCAKVSGCTDGVLGPIVATRGLSNG